MPSKQRANTEMYRKSPLLSTRKGYDGHMTDHKAPYTKIAWTLIIIAVACIAYLQTRSSETKSDQSDDSAGLVMEQIQAEYLLGVASMSDEDQEIASAAIMLDAGSIGQRQRYMAFMIALGDTEAMHISIIQLRADLDEAGLELTPLQATVQEQLEIVANGGELPEGSSELEESLGWFGELVIADSQERKFMNATAESKVFTVGVVFLFVAFAGFVGFGGLIFCFIRALIGNAHSSMNAASAEHGIYAEVFALWLPVIIGLITLASYIANSISPDGMVIGKICTLIAFFSSLLVLFWARLRGLTWKQIKSDIGWTTGNGVGKEVFFGIAGYAMMLPILGIGILLTLLLMLIQQEIGGGADPFSGTGGGSHPIIVDIAEGGWNVRILLLVLAAVAAPIVEETMFRGVLYRQLRSSSNLLGVSLSIILSVLLTSFIFAAIHPQGWIAIPALMGIAIGMNLMREWRGTLLPSMIVHGISNGIVISMLIVFLR